LQFFSKNIGNYKKLVKNILLINILIPILHSAIILFISFDQKFFIAILFFSIIQILNIYEYRRGEIAFIYVFILNFIGLILVGQISVFFAVTSALRIYFT